MSRETSSGGIGFALRPPGRAGPHRPYPGLEAFDRERAGEAQTVGEIELEQRTAAMLVSISTSSPNRVGSRKRARLSTIG